MKPNKSAQPSATPLCPGSHLVTRRSGYYHHGIYVGNGRVVHYAGLCGLHLHAGPVVEVELAEFAAGHGCEVIDDSGKRFGADQIVARARSRIGENKYSVLHNNCEHFCSWCINGAAVSTQVVDYISGATRALCVVCLTSLIGGLTLLA